MDSDVDADIPVRMKPTIKLSSDSKSPSLPYQPSIIRSQHTLSPVSNYSIKSSKDRIDVSEIRRVLTKLKNEIEYEKKRNRDLIDNNIKELEIQKNALEEKHSKEMFRINLSWQTKLEEIQKSQTRQYIEIRNLKQKINESSNMSSSFEPGSKISNMDDIIAKMNKFCNSESNYYNNHELLKIINDLNQLVKGQIPKQQENQITKEMKYEKLKNQNTELTNIVKMLDRKLKIKENEIKELTEKQFKENKDNQEGYGTNEKNMNLEIMLKRAISERLQLEKQLSWLQTSDETNPATREKVEVLFKLLKSFQVNQKSLENQLKIFQEKSDKVDNLINDILVLKTENGKLTERLLQNSVATETLEKLKRSIEVSETENQEKSIKIKFLENRNIEYKEQLLTMERLLKYIRETSEKRNELEMEYAAMKSLLETKLRNDFAKRESNPSIRDENSEESTDNLKAELRELEKRCTQQALNYEEALLELETLKKSNQRYSLDLYHRNGSKDDIHNCPGSKVIEEIVNFNNDEFGKLYDSYGIKNTQIMKNDDKRETTLFGKSDTEADKNYPKDNKMVPYQQSNNENFNNDLNSNNEPEINVKHVPAPIQIKIENHPNQKNTKVVRWKAPEIDIDKFIISAYHIYIDGHFYKGVNVKESLSAVLPILDIKKAHRIVIRSVCSQGQSKDAQCTIELGSFSLAPSNLKANKITGTSAQISWIPSNSNWKHSVWVNGNKYCDCLPGTYKIMMQGLTPDSLQKVQVHPVIDRFVDNSPNSNNCSHLDFQTLPLYTNFEEPRKPTDEIEYPMDVKLKLGSRPGRFIVKWVCPQQVTLPNIKIVGYSILINNQCIALVNGAKNDRFTINLHDLRNINPPATNNLLGQRDQSYLSLTVRTMATITQTDYDNKITECTIYSKDSQPILRFSGHVAARIAGTAAEASIILGDKLASFLNLMHSFDHEKINDSRACWHSCYCLNNNEFYDNESSFLPRSNFDWIENNPYQYRSMSIHYLDQPRLNNHHRSLSDDSALDRLSDSRELRQNLSSELIDDTCSTESSSNSHNFMYQNTAADCGSIHRKSITEIPSRGDDDPNKYLIIRHNSKQVQSPKSSKEYPQPKISVPKIQITKDSSFSEDDENQSMMSFRNKSRHMNEQLGKIGHQQKGGSRSYVDYKNRSNPSMDDISVIKNTNYPMPQNERNTNQNQWPNNNNSEKSEINNERYNYVNQKPVENIRYFIALFDYDPATMSPNSGAIHEELPFKAGQNIKIFGQVDEDGFYTGETNGRRGLVPSNMVSEIDMKNKLKSAENYNAQFQDKNIASGDRTNDPHLSRSLQGMLNTEFGQESQPDYPMNQNQYGYNQYPSIHRKSTDSAVSYAASDPNSYQRPPIENYVPHQIPSGNSRNLSDCRKMLALYDYDPQTLSPNVDSDAELAFKCNDIIEIISDIDEDGFYMGRKNGQRGLVPSNFLTDLPPSFENRSRNQPNFQNSFDNSHIPNQYKERNCPDRNFPDQPQPRDNRSRSKPFDSERSPLSRNTSNATEEYITDRAPTIENQKNNPSFEESFDSGSAAPRNYMVKSEVKSTHYHNNSVPRMPIHDPGNDNKMIQYQSGPPNNKLPNRSNKPILARRSSHDKQSHRNQPPLNIPPRDLSPPPPLEADDMPIVMDLAPSKEIQKKKKALSNTENYRSNVFENQENYGNNENLYVNSNSVMSDNLERKRSVFKNPFKKKKS